MGNGANRGSRTIYVDIQGKIEKIVFSSYCCSRDIKDLLAGTVKINRWSNMILKDEDNSLIAISPTMPANTHLNPYKLEIIPAKSQPEEGNEDIIKNMLTNVAEQFNKAFKVEELKIEVVQRLNLLERRIEMEGLKVIEIEKCKKEISELKDEMYKQNNKYIDYNRIRPFYCKYLCSSMSDEKKISLKRDIPTYPKYTLSEETIEYLKKPTFDIWHWEPNEMLSLLEHMYHELDLVHEFNINPITLKRWLLCVQENYRNNPFHNFRHCFCVTQMMYGMIHLSQLQNKMSRTDLGILITASVCHDLDHPGYNNSYQINARTELAIRYNDISPLENHHCAVAFQILSQPECNIFANVSAEKFKEIRSGIIMLILATDMARHGEILESFKSKLEEFDFSNEEHLNSLRMVLIKCCDISNEVRPMEVSEPWLDCLLEEYFNQSDREKIEGLPVAPFMDRDKVTKPTAQIGFIKFVLIPMFECVGKLFPQIDPVMVVPLREARDHYEHLKAEDDAKRVA